MKRSTLWMLLNRRVLQRSLTGPPVRCPRNWRISEQDTLSRETSFDLIWEAFEPLCDISTYLDLAVKTQISLSCGHNG